MSDYSPIIFNESNLPPLLPPLQRIASLYPVLQALSLPLSLSLSISILYHPCQRLTSPYHTVSIPSYLHHTTPRIHHPYQHQLSSLLPLSYCTHPILSAPHHTTRHREDADAAAKSTLAGTVTAPAAATATATATATADPAEESEPVTSPMEI